jgi:hypothetical protein
MIFKKIHKKVWVRNESRLKESESVPLKVDEIGVTRLCR